MSYFGYVTTIKELRKHSNADRLQVATLFGNDVIVGLDVQVGDLGVYFPTDGKLGLEFARANKLLREKDEHGNNVGGYLDPQKRHVSTIRLRGEKSDGLFMSIECLSKFCKVEKLKEGDTISTLHGVLICEKYVPIKKKSNPNPSEKSKKKKIDHYPFFQEHSDTSQFAYNTHNFKEGDKCIVTLKLHGTSQRTARTIKEKNTTIHKLLKRIGLEFTKKWEYISGTRRVTLKNYEGGYYGGNGFRQKWHDLFKEKLHKGEEIYYEVVGYAGVDQLIMPECDNKKTKDKEFINTYGEKTRFTYGCENGQSDIYVYRMTMTNEDGYVVEYPWHLVKLRCEQMGVKHCPELDSFKVTTKVHLLEMVKQHEEGIDPVGKTHVREGVIVRIENREKFSAYKQKNFHFKVLEGIIKSEDVLDMEEENSSETSE